MDYPCLRRRVISSKLVDLVLLMMQLIFYDASYTFSSLHLEGMSFLNIHSFFPYELNEVCEIIDEQCHQTRERKEVRKLSTRFTHKRRAPTGQK